MRGWRLVGMVAGALVGLLLLALLAVKLLVNPNDYRARIEQAVQQSTGRQLQLTGDLKLSVFPWLALELGPASIGNPPGFGTEPFATLQKAAFRVRLLPLLGKRLQVGHIEIDRLDLRLLKSADGRGNWQPVDSTGQKPKPAAQVADDSAGAGMLQEIDGISVRESRISYQDTVVDHINLDTGSFTSGAAMPVELTAMLHPAANAAAVPWSFNSPALKLDLAAGSLEVPSFSTQLDKARMTGSVRGQEILSAAALTGSFKLEQMSPRDLMSAMAMPAPATRDPKALSSFAASGQFSYGNNSARASGLDLQLDESRLQGDAAITNLDTNALKFNLTLDRINVDRYLSPASPTPRAPPPGNAGNAGNAGNTSAQRPSSADPGDPGNALRKLQLEGAFAIGNLTVANLNLSQVNINVVAKDGVMHVAPMNASLYNGSLSADITLTSTSTFGLKLEQTLSNVDIAGLLKDLANTQRLSGHGNVTTRLTAQGWDAPALMRTMNGRVTANLSDGAVEGVDLWFEINRAMALIQQQPMPSGNSSGRTRFDAFKASADLGNGVATTKDLTITSQNLRIAGQGSSNLINDQINYQVTATVLKELPSAAKASGTKLADIPLTVTGTLSNPQVRPDLEGMAKARLQKELDRHQDEIKQKVQDTLQGLFK